MNGGGVEPASHAAFHAHLDACERCRSKPFDLCSEGDSLLKGVAPDSEPRVAVVLAPDAYGLSGVWMRPLEESRTPLEKIQRLLEKELVGLGPLLRAVKLEKIARSVAKLAAESGDAKGEAFWLARADQALHAAERLAREAARDPKGSVN